MELVKNIFFNTDKIVEGATVRISYIGYLFQNASKDVYIHYGYGKNWENISDIKTEKTELGYQAKITIPHGYETLNLCFKNESDEWDNNNGNNYIFNIEPCAQNTTEENIQALSEFDSETIGQTSVETIDVINNFDFDTGESNVNSNTINNYDFGTSNQNDYIDTIIDSNVGTSNQNDNVNTINNYDFETDEQINSVDTIINSDFGISNQNDNVNTINNYDFETCEQIDYIDTIINSDVGISNQNNNINTINTYDFGTGEQIDYVDTIINSDIGTINQNDDVNAINTYDFETINQNDSVDTIINADFETLTQTNSEIENATNFIKSENKLNSNTENYYTSIGDINKAANAYNVYDIYEVNDNNINSTTKTANYSNIENSSDITKTIVHTTTPHNIESTQNTNNTDTNYLTVTEESNIAIHTGLKRTYLLGKKIKLALYKIIKYIPKVILGNCKRNAKE